MTPDPIETVFRQQLQQWLEDNRPQNSVRAAKGGDVALATAQNRRDENEDRAFYAEFQSPRVERSFALLAVLDGIGGLVDGGECAELAITSILSKLLVPRKTKQRVALIEALATANDEVRTTYRGRGGVTFAGVFIQDKRVTSINVGDTRVYQFDSSRGGLKRLSTDDRLGDQIAKLKGLENIDLDPDLASRLGQFLGMQDAVRPNIRLIESDALRSPVGYFLVVTDGAYSVGEPFISNVLKNHFEPKEIVAAVVQDTASNPGGDNATFACARANQLVAPRPGRRDSVPFEQLQIWTTEGSFSFVIPQRIPADARRSPSRRQRHRSRASDDHEPPSPAVHEKGKREAGKEPRGESPKRELIIQQLSFEEENEPTD